MASRSRATEGLAEIDARLRAKADAADQFPSGGLGEHSRRTPQRQAVAHEEVHQAISRARAAASTQRVTHPALRDRALIALADALDERGAEVLEANARDIDTANNPQAAERLVITADDLAELSDELRKWAKLANPVGEVVRRSRRGDGTEFHQLRVPIGVVAVLYEEQVAPAFRGVGPLLKSGNAVLLRGARGATGTSTALVELTREALTGAGLPADAVQLVSSMHRVTLMDVITAQGQIDLLIPLLGPGMRGSVLPEATVPIVDLGSGACHCHIYVDARADLALATAAVLASTVEHPEIAATADTVLVHARVADAVLPRLCAQLIEAGVVVHGDARARAIEPRCLEATDDDWRTDHHGHDLAIAVVDSAEEAIAHIGRFSTGHTDAVISEDDQIGRAFAAHVDSASVVINAATTTVDSDDPADICFGYSTQRLAPRGPLGLSEFTTTKWIVHGRRSPAIPRQAHGGYHT